LLAVRVCRVHHAPPFHAPDRSPDAQRGAVTLALAAAIDHRGYAFRRELIKMAVPVSEMMPWITPHTAHIFSHLKTPLGDARHLIANHPMEQNCSTGPCSGNVPALAISGAA
jgi:hypothetical protein